MQDPPIDVEALRWRRAELRWTQEMLAVRAGLTTSFIKKVEQGRRGMSLQGRMQVAAALGCHPDDLLVKPRKHKAA